MQVGFKLGLKFVMLDDTDLVLELGEIFQVVKIFWLGVGIFDKKVVVIDGYDFHLFVSVEGFFGLFVFPVGFGLLGLPLVADFVVFGLGVVGHVVVELLEFPFVHVDGGDGPLVLEVAVFDILDEALVDLFERFGFLHWKCEYK